MKFRFVGSRSQINMVIWQLFQPKVNKLNKPLLQTVLTSSRKAAHELHQNVQKPFLSQNTEITQIINNEFVKKSWI